MLDGGGGGGGTEEDAGLPNPLLKFRVGAPLKFVVRCVISLLLGGGGGGGMDPLPL